MKIKISQQRLFYLMDYESSTEQFTWKKSTSNVVRKKRKISKNKKSRYLRIQLDGNRYYAHHLAWLWFYGKLPKTQIDHINCDSFDNRICNLRLSNQQQNCFNRSKAKNNTSGTKGVVWHPKQKKWNAVISFNNQKIHLGSFDNLTSARIAVRDARIQFHGDFFRD